MYGYSYGYILKNANSDQLQLMVFPYFRPYGN